MRLFVAADFDDRVKKTVMDRSRLLHSHSKRGNFTTWDNIHLTFAFLGETDPKDVGRISAALDGIAFAPFRIRFEGIGSFPSAGAVRLVYLQADKSADLLDVATAVRTVLRNAAVTFDPKPFVPHLTIARECDANDESTSAVGKLPAIEANVSALALFESLRVDGRLVYRKLHAVSGSAPKR